jgi:hypothetical protein
MLNKIASYLSRFDNWFEDVIDGPDIPYDNDDVIERLWKNKQEKSNTIESKDIEKSNVGEV